jgi:glycosyltransferase involved in cell wall biosynthesis
VVVNGFPRLSETFVLHELLDLERRGIRLHLIALRYPDEVVQHAALSDLAATVEYLPDLTLSERKLAIRAAHVALFMRSRGRYLNGLAEVIASPDYEPPLLKHVVILAHRLLRLGAPPVYIHFAHKPATIGRFAALLAGVPYALSAHAKDVWLTPPNELAVKVRGAETVLACTEEARAYLVRLAGGTVPVRLARHGVEIPPAPRPAPANPVPIILGVGRLVEKKGYDVLLRASALLRDRGIDFTLRIVGEGPEWPRLQRLVHELSLADRAFFLGPLTQAEVAGEYARADIFALACRRLPNGDRDGTPNVIVEAMARGLPVASTNLAAISEAIVDGESGLLTPQGDEVALAGSLARLLTEHRLAARLGTEARVRTAERFDRAANLPAVHAALAAAGIVAPHAPKPAAAIARSEQGDWTEAA